MKKIYAPLLCAVVLMATIYSISDLHAKSLPKSKKVTVSPKKGKFSPILKKGLDNNWYEIQPYIHIVDSTGGDYHYQGYIRLTLASTSCDLCGPGTFIQQTFGADYNITYYVKLNGSTYSNVTFDMASLAYMGTTIDFYANHHITMADVEEDFSENITSSAGLPIGPSPYFETY